MIDSLASRLAASHYFAGKAGDEIIPSNVGENEATVL